MRKFGIDTTKVYQSKNLEDFDNLLTGPLHGFKDADDYYKQSSSINFLDNIKIPTMIVNAKNDPFLGPDCYPEINNKNITFLVPEYGGHVGFYIDKNISLADIISENFFNPAI